MSQNDAIRNLASLCIVPCDIAGKILAGDDPNYSGLMEKGMALLAPCLELIMANGKDVSPVYPPQIYLLPVAQLAEGGNANYQPDSSILTVAVNAANFANVVMECLIQHYDKVPHPVSAQLRFRNADALSQAETTPRNNTATGFGYHGRGSHYALDEPAGKDKDKKNSGSDYKRWQAVHNKTAELALIAEHKFWLERILSDDIIKTLRPNDLLRSLRLLSGHSTIDADLALGFIRGTYSKYETGELNKGRIPYKFFEIFINKNFWHLPTDSEGQVLPEIKEKLLRKLCDPRIHPQFQAQLSAAVKAVAIETTSGTIPKFASDLPAIVSALSRGRFSFEQVYYKPDVLPQLGPASKYLGLLKHRNKKRVTCADKQNTKMQIAVCQIFDTLSAVKSDIDFFIWWSDTSGITRESVGKKLGNSTGLVAGVLSQSRSIDNCLTDYYLKKFVEKNAFELPCDADGKVDPDIVAGLWAIHRGEKFTSPYLYMIPAARAAEIPVPAVPEQWAERICSERFTEYSAWKEYWTALSTERKKAGKIIVGEQEIRTWPDAYGHLRVHKGDIILLEENFPGHSASLPRSVIAR